MVDAAGRIGLFREETMECCNLGGRAPANVWTRRNEIEGEALTQLGNISRLPWVVHLAVMPDVHYGKGAPVPFQ
jgi:RNA-splicing ligase RtcB